MKIILRILRSALLIYILLCGLVFFAQKSLIFFPSQNPFEIPTIPGLKEVNITTVDHMKLNGWYLDNHGDTTVLFFHGNGGNISFNDERLATFKTLKVNALMIDYRGYGKSEWKIQHESDLYADADAAYKYLIDAGIPSEKIIIWWQSLGAAIAIYESQNKKIRWTIAESAFTSMDDMAKAQYPLLPTALLLRFHFPSIERISQLTSPLLVIHSTEDELIPYSHGRQLFESASVLKQFLETRGGHNEGFQRSNESYIFALNLFFAKH